MSHRPRKRFGQNFLHGSGVIDRIVQAIAPEPGQRLVEIGPGHGALTAPLLERAERLDVVELDRDLAAELRASTWAQSGGLTVHEADALGFDFASLAESGSEIRVVGNLPYNISTPLLFHLLDAAPVISDLHLMLQREVVERMAAGPGSKTYGRLSVMLQYRCRVERLFLVKPGAFRPVPKVFSEVVRLTPHRQAPVPVLRTSALEEVTRRAFAQRRKTLRNALKEILAEVDIAAAGVDPSARAETLSLAAFAALANRYVDRGGR